MAGLVDIEDRLLRQRAGEFGVGARDRGAGFFPGGVRAAQTDRDLQGPLEEPLHHEPWHPTDDRQIRDHRGELRAELALMLARQGRLRGVAAPPTSPSVTLKLRDVRGHRRELGHLMPPRIPLIVGRVQSTRTLAALWRMHVHDRVHPIHRDQAAPVARMAWLGAARPSAVLPPAAHARLTREPIRRRRLGRHGGILLAHRELALQLGNLLRLLGQLPGLFRQRTVTLVQPLTQPLIFSAKRLDVVRVAQARLRRYSDRPHGTRPPCTVTEYRCFHRAQRECGH